MSSTDPLHLRLWASLRSQWLAGTLIIPLILLGLNVHTANEAAKEARIQSARIERINRFQDSGKTLDLALAAYFQSLAEAGLAEHKVKMPGAYELTPVRTAEKEVIETRESARQALVKHAGDVKALRGTIDEVEARHYMAALSEMTTTVDRTPDIKSTGANITVLSKLVVARDRLVDAAMKRVG
jgi:hypothetical protein